jgi:hypothetical protein
VSNYVGCSFNSNTVAGLAASQVGKRVAGLLASPGGPQVASFASVVVEFLGGLVGGGCFAAGTQVVVGVSTPQSPASIVSTPTASSLQKPRCSNITLACNAPARCPSTISPFSQKQIVTRSVSEESRASLTLRVMIGRAELDRWKAKKSSAVMPWRWVFESPSCLGGHLEPGLCDPLHARRRVSGYTRGQVL